MLKHLTLNQTFSLFEGILGSINFYISLIKQLSHLIKTIE